MTVEIPLMQLFVTKQRNTINQNEKLALRNVFLIIFIIIKNTLMYSGPEAFVDRDTFSSIPSRVLRKRVFQIRQAER